jgi:anaerobic magnesium-protoporphyrin IX monomethyl ester cyclase
MKAVLVQPVGKGLFRVPPLGLGYLAAMLKNKGFEAKIIDLNVESSVALEESLSRERPEVVGVSSAIGNARQALAVVSKVKTHFPECFVVVGGPYASMMGEAMLVRHREIDAVVVGEGEVTFVELLERLQNKQDLSDVNGLIFRDGNKTRNNPSRDPVEALDSLPFPAREKLPMKSYGDNGGVLFTSRGCPYQCVFCSRSVYGRRWRGHSPEHVLTEIEHLRKHYGVNGLSFLDDNFAFDLGRAEKILDGIIAKKWKLSFYLWNGIRVDSVTEGLLIKMKKAGCTAINYGVESVDPEVLNRIKKGIALDQVDKATKLASEAGIKANVFLMIGNPGDTVKVVDKIRRFVERIKVDGVHLSLATPIPGTEFWSWVDKSGHWLGYDREELLDWPVDDVEDTYPVFETADFTAKQRIEAYRETRKYFVKKKLLI